jgi:hypothetical protein
MEAPATAIADEQLAGDDDDVAIPTPIAMLMFQDGRTEPVYQPLAGHEHLFKPQHMSRPQTSPISGTISTIRPGKTLTRCITGSLAYFRRNFPASEPSVQSSRFPSRTSGRASERNSASEAQKGHCSPARLTQVQELENNSIHRSGTSTKSQGRYYQR